MRKHIRHAARFILGESQIAGLRRLLDPLRRRKDRKRLEAARERYLAWLRTRLGDRSIELPSTPFPPRELLLKTTASEAREFDRRFASGSYEARYLASGYDTWLEWFGLAERHGLSPREVASVFELGCGTAPMLRHLIGVAGMRLVACDVNPEMIEWCRQHVRGPEYHVSGLSPPLVFAHAAEFDLAYAYSVFTHIPLNTQLVWIEEIARVLKPNGWFLCTLAGKRHQDRFLSDEQRQKLNTEGHIEITSGDREASLSTQLGGSQWDVYQTEDEIRSNFGKFFAIMEYSQARNQDLLIMRKPTA